MCALLGQPHHDSQMPSNPCALTREKETEKTQVTYFVLDEYLVTALVPSETACLASSPGRMRRTEVWISREEIVDFLLYAASLEASVATRSKMSDEGQKKERCECRGHNSPLTKELRMDMARLEIPVSGWTCFRTAGALATVRKSRVATRYAGRVQNSPL